MPIARLLREVYADVQAALDDDLREFAVTPAQYGVLRRLEEGPGSSAAQIARRVRVSPQAMHELLRPIERNGWVRKTPDPELGRVLRIELTQSGQALLAECNERAHALADQLVVDLQPSERHELGDLLLRAQASLARQRRAAGDRSPARRG